MIDQTIFERAARTAWETYLGISSGPMPSWEDLDDFSRAFAGELARAVIQTILAHTGSPCTVDELTRILGEA